jgi:hypothetical protein
MWGNIAHVEHLAGVAMVSILDHGDINIDDVAVLEFFIIGDAVTNHLIYRGADRLGEAVVVERGRNGLLLVNDVFVADLVQFIGCHARLDIWLNHFENFRCQSAGGTHLFNLFRGLDFDSHKYSVLALEGMPVAVGREAGRELASIVANKTRSAKGRFKKCIGYGINRAPERDAQASVGAFKYIN